MCGLFAPSSAAVGPLPAVRLARDCREAVDQRFPLPEGTYVAGIPDHRVKQVVEPASLEDEDDLGVREIDRVAVESELVGIERRAALDQHRRPLLRIRLELCDDCDAL